MMVIDKAKNGLFMYTKSYLPLFILIVCYSVIYSQSQSKTDSLLRIVSSQPTSADLVKVYEQLAVNYAKMNKSDSAHAFFDRVLVLCNESDDIEMVAKVMYGKSKIYEISGEYAMAEKYLYDAKLRYSVLNDTLNLIKVDQSFADIYGKQRKFDKAISIYQRILVYHRLKHNHNELCKVLSNLGVVYEGLEEYEKALNSYKDCLYYAEILGNKNQMAIVNMNIGSIYFEIGQYDSVLVYLEKSRAVLLENAFMLPLIHNLLLTGNYYYAVNKLQKTEELYLEAYNTAEKYGFKDYIKMASESLSMVYEDMNDYKNALKYAKIFKVNYDSLINEKNIREQTVAEEGYKYKIKLLLKEKEIEKEKQKKDLFLIIGIIILASLIIVIFYRWRLQKNKLIQVEQNNRIKVQNVKIKIQRSERKRVANILHDNLAHVISDTYSKTTRLIELSTETKFRQILLQIEESLDFMNKLAKVASYELEFSFVLENNLVDEFEKYIIRIQHSYQAKISLQHSEKKYFEYLQNEIKTNIFSVFQEMLGNAIKYSKANHINILLFIDGEKTVLQVEDDGIGFDYNEERHGQGFPNMKERAAKLNGTFIYESEKGFGTKLKFIV